MLKHILRANAASCGLFGAIFVLAAPATANLIGDPPSLALQLLGIMLLGNAALLIWTSTLEQPNRETVLLFALGDLLWVAGTAVLLIAGYWITTTSGVAWSLSVAVLVGTFGFLQWKLAPMAETK